MNVIVNGRPTDVGQDLTVIALVEAQVPGGARRGVAVAVDGEVVPRSAWETHTLGPDNRVEILNAVQGG